MADTLILEGTTSLELSAKGSGSDVRSWAKGQVGRRGAQLFINNIAEPGNVDTIINLHNGEVGIGTATPSAKLHVETGRPGPLVLVRNTSGSDGLRSESTGGGHGLSGASLSHTGTEGASESGIGVHGLSSRGPACEAKATRGLDSWRRRSRAPTSSRRSVSISASSPSRRPARCWRRTVHRSSRFRRDASSGLGGGVRTWRRPDDRSGGHHGARGQVQRHERGRRVPRGPDTWATCGRHRSKATPHR